jgi:hypothetical protein
MIRAFFAGMSPGAIAIVGAIAASIFWMCVCFWLLGKLDKERHTIPPVNARRARW